jgi:hypothetical protein
MSEKCPQTDVNRPIAWQILQPINSRSPATCPDRALTAPPKIERIEKHRFSPRPVSQKQHRRALAKAGR